MTSVYDTIKALQRKGLTLDEALEEVNNKLPPLAKLPQNIVNRIKEDNNK